MFELYRECVMHKIGNTNKPLIKKRCEQLTHTTGFITD